MTNLNESKKINLEKLPDEKLVRNFESGKQVISKEIIWGAILIIIVGIFTGFILSKYSSKRGASVLSSGGSTVTKGKSVGSSDTKTFPDSADGKLEAGGLSGEGTHKLIRPGGESQTVYLTSSIVDLNQFVGKKVKIWGQTFSAKRAGWLMDVGRVKVL